MNKLKNLQDVLNQDTDLKTAATLAIEKFKIYYPMTNGLAYIITTSKLIKVLFYHTNKISIFALLVLDL